MATKESADKKIKDSAGQKKAEDQGDKLENEAIADISSNQIFSSWKKNRSKKEIEQELAEAKLIKNEQKKREEKNKELPLEAERLLKTMLGEDAFQREERPVSFAVEPEQQNDKETMSKEAEKIVKEIKNIEPQPEAPISIAPAEEKKEKAVSKEAGNKDLGPAIKKIEEEFKGESPLFSEQAKKFGDVRMAANIDTTKLKKIQEAQPLGADVNLARAGKSNERNKQQKEELVAELDAAYKELYSLLNDKKVVPPQVYRTLFETEEKLRGAVKYQGEVGNIAEEIKAKYKKDTRAEEKKDENIQKNINEVPAKEKNEQPFSLEQVKQAEAAVQGIKEGKIDIADVPEELKQVVKERLKDDVAAAAEHEAWQAAKEKEPIIKDSKYIEKEGKKEEAEKALEAARQEYVAALSENSKRKDGVSKLQTIRDKFVHYFQGNKEQEHLRQKDERLSGVAAEKAEAEQRLAQAQKTYKETLKNYRDQGVLEKTAELKAAGKAEEEINGEMEKYAKDILLAATLREAAKVDSLKSDKQIEQMGGARRFINEKAEEFTGWYKKLPWQGKVAVSAGLAVAGVAGGLLGSTAIITSALVGQGALRVLGGSMATAGIEQLVKRSQEKQAEKKLSKEFEGKFLETLKNKNEELDNKLFELIKTKEREKTRRFVLAGTMGALVGSGALGLAVKNTVHWISDSSLGQTVKNKIFGGAPLAGEKATVDLSIDKKPIIAKPAIESLKIGTRGPEGAIIDNFKAKPELAKAFGWDGKTDISKWSGTKAHQLWLDSVKGELAKPGMAAKLTAQGFSADAEGYAKAMHKIGAGFVELDPQGHMHLSDNTTFFKAAVNNLADTAKDIPVEPIAPDNGLSPHDIMDNLPAENKTPLSAEDLANQKIKGIVEKFVDPAILDDKTFKAAAKVPLSKILDSIPPEAYQDKYALSHYWHGLGEIGSKPLDLPGSSWAGVTYDDFKKYAEMAKFLRENSGVISSEKIKGLTVGEFLNNYGSGLSKAVKEQISDKITEVAPSNVKAGVLGEALSEEKIAAAAKNASQAVEAPAEKTAEVIKPALASTRNAFLEKTISSGSAYDLAKEISAGNITVEDFAKDYAQHSGAEKLSEPLMQTLRKNFSTIISGSEGIEKVKATRAINAMLEKIKQGK
ncbi:MAG TPA: hypothetical protein P5089_02085 [Candidatus Portnoybacteria bacterium]|nr:hypothetical protein [Candidatus Portnoybacteria bacterium]